MEAVILDLDGVLRRGRNAIEGSVEAVDHLKRLNIPICYLTNNSTRSREVITGELCTMGYPEAEMVTSAQAAGAYLNETMGPSRCLVVGEEGLLIELEREGHSVQPAGGDGGGSGYDAVVAGLDRDLTYRKVKDALWAIRNGASFIATNRDPTLPVEGGKVLPGAGTTISAITTCSGTEPVVVGKPETYSTRLAISRLGIDPVGILMIGDRPDTDILAGKRAGCNVAMVLSGDAGMPNDADHPVYNNLLELVKDMF